jgi:hypothetical protein
MRVVRTCCSARPDALPLRLVFEADFTAADFPEAGFAAPRADFFPLAALAPAGLPDADFCGAGFFFVAANPDGSPSRTNAASSNEQKDFTSTL